MKKQMNDMIVEKLEAMLADDTLEDIVWKHVKNMIEGVCSNVFDRRNSTTKTLLTERLEKQLEIWLWNIELQNYSALVQDVVQKEIAEFMETQAVAKIKSAVARFLELPKKSEYTLQELVNELKPSEYNKESDWSVSCFVEIDTSWKDYMHHHIYLDCDDESDKRSCDYHLVINKEWFVDFVYIDSYSRKQSYNYYWMDAFIFSLYTSRVKITNFNEEIDTERDFYD